MTEFMNLKKNYLRFLKNLKKFSKQEQNIIKNAYRVARNSHARQRRDEGLPYIIHPIRIANILMTKFKEANPSVVAAALLHDVVEDTPVTITQIKKIFDHQTYQLVQGMTRSRPKNETEAQKRKSKKKNFRKIMMSNKELNLIKSIDILDNMRSWRFIAKGHPSEKKFKRWLEEAKLFYLPLAKQTDNYIYQEMRKALSLFKKKYKKVNPAPWP